MCRNKQASRLGFRPVRDMVGLQRRWPHGYLRLTITSGPDQLFKNQGDGTFVDVITETVNEIPWFSMGSDAGDINNDGRLDLIALDMAPTSHYKSKMAMGEMGSSRWAVENVKPRQLMRNVCFLNTGTARFIETAQLSGIASTDWSWAAKLADFDNDGRVDLRFQRHDARLQQFGFPI